MKTHSLEHQQPYGARFVLLVVGIIFVAFNLRPSLTSVGPLIHSIRADMHISSGVAGMLTTLPLIAFAVLSPLAPKISYRWGNVRTIMFGLMVLLIGIFIRSEGLMIGLFAGTVLIGSGVAICNVLLPSVVKHKFPTKVGLMTSVYTTAMGACATIGSGVSVPLAHGLGLGWQNAFLFWGALVIVGALLWLPQVFSEKKPASPQQGQFSEASLWRSPLAWKLTFFMGLQSFLFYCTITWLPEILHSQEISESTAGWMLAFVQLVGLPATFAAPVLAERLPDQRGIVAGIGVLYFSGIAGLLFGGGLPLIVLWTFLIGLGQGASISLSLTMIGMRSSNARQTAALSGMAQSIGYLLAALGPVSVGFLFDQTQSWVVPLLVMLAVTIAVVMAGVGAGRNEKVGSTQG